MRYFILKHNSITSITNNFFQSFASIGRVDLVHNSSPNYKQHRQLGTCRLSPSNYCPYDAPKEYLFANLPTKPHTLSVYAWELSQAPSPNALHQYALNMNMNFITKLKEPTAWYFNQRTLAKIEVHQSIGSSILPINGFFCKA